MLPGLPDEPCWLHITIHSRCLDNNSALFSYKFFSHQGFFPLMLKTITHLDKTNIYIFTVNTFWPSFTLLFCAAETCGSKIQTNLCRRAASKKNLSVMQNNSLQWRVNMFLYIKTICDFVLIISRVFFFIMQFSRSPEGCQCGSKIWQRIL